MKFFTIGVYNSTEKEFFDKLVNNEIDTFCDIRQRRGVRGPKYAFVNSTKLQARLKKLGIKYKHVIDLAPTTAIRTIQKQTDQQNKELNTERKHLSRAFEIEYKKKIIDKFDFENFFKSLEEIQAKRIVFFCVEELAEACHRSVVTRELHERYGYSIVHL